jgi:hypothetical protein
MRRIVLAVLFALAACKAELSPTEQARSDAADVAKVEAAQQVRAPVQPLVLQPLGEADSARAGLSGAGCSFVPAGQEQPVLTADLSRAIIKSADATIDLAVDSGADGAVRHYVGKVFVGNIDQGADRGQAWGEEGMKYAATLTLQDRDRRQVYRAAGSLYCGA